MAATRVGEDSSIQRMIRLVQSADADKAKIVNLADRWAVWIVVIALVAAVLTYLVTGEIIRSVTILVVFCPCALVLATPTAIMAAIGNATRHGFLVREGDALERLAQVRRVCFDKTGTLTTGEPQVVAVCAGEKDVSEDALLAVAGAAEKRSEHPPRARHRGRGHGARRSGAEGTQTSFAMVPGPRRSGRGGRAHGVRRQRCAAGGARSGYTGRAGGGAWTLRAPRGQRSPISAGGDTAAGFIALADRVRENATATLSAVRETGVEPVPPHGGPRGGGPPTWLPNSASPPTKAAWPA